MNKNTLPFFLVVFSVLAIIFSSESLLSNPQFDSIRNVALAVIGTDSLNVYDGNQAALLQGTSDHPCLTYGTEVSPGRDGTGKALKLTPDGYHSGGYSVNCGGQDRLDFSSYAYLEFYIKGTEQSSGNRDFNIVSYYGQSNTVNLLNYISGGKVDGTWRLVSIPTSALKTANYNLNTVDTLYFGTDNQNRVFYIDDIALRNTKTVVAPLPTVQTSPTPYASSVPVVVQPPTSTRGTITISDQPISNTNNSSNTNTNSTTNTSPSSNNNFSNYKPPVQAPDPVVLPSRTIVKPPILKAAAASTDETYDYDEVDLANRFGQWVYTDSTKYVTLNFTKKYDVGSVTNISNYRISSNDDPKYSNAQNPLSVGYSWHTIYVPTIRLTNLKVAYRVYLALPSPLVNGKTYTISANNLGMTADPFTFTFSDNDLNNDIRVNQVGYLPTSAKKAYVGQYMGTLGPMPFSLSSFEVKDAATGVVVYNGVPALRSVDTNNTGENLYDLDFSSFNKPGAYYIHVPGVGISYTFRIGTDVYNEVLTNAFHGAYQQRSGTSLTSDYTRFTHSSAHTDDAYVMNENPIPDWFRQRFDSEGDTHLKDASGKRYYYPTSLSGQHIDTTKGHYDAGDYGKYVINGSLFVGDILAAYDAFPDHLMKDDLNVPESGNGIPDLIDEVKWELDWLENMQDPNDGGVFCIVKPDGAVEYYENRTMDTASPSKRLLYPKDTTCTAAYAAALAKAGRSTLIQKYYPDAAKRYITKAEKAWQFLAKTPGYLGWHHYGLKDEFDTDKSMDERVWASIELFGATGKKDYMDFFIAHANPEYERWGWNTLFEASGQADYACAFMSRDGMNIPLKDRCVKEIVKAADSHVTDSNNRAYRLSMSDAPLNYRDYTYFFPQERIIQLLIANSLKNNPAYTQTALFNWDYVLGDNPTSYSYITGIGSKRFRDPVSTQSVYDDIKEPIPGLPIGMGNNFGYLEVYGSSLAQMFPVNNGGSPNPKVSYPLLKQVYDGWNIGVEYTIPEIAEDIVSASYFATMKDKTNKPPSSISIVANPESGPAPLTVNFTASGSDPDGKITRYFWDFDDESYSAQQNPAHVFKDPYKLYRVVLTVTDNDGAEKFKEIDIRTSPAVFNFTSEEYQSNVNTIALFHFNQSLKDDSSHGYEFKTTGNAHLSSDNVQWMKKPSGQSMTFNSVNDTASVSIPGSTLSDGTVVAEAKIYIDSYLSLNTKSSNIFTLTQGDDKALGFYDAIYVDGPHITAMASYDSQKIILTQSDLSSLAQAGTMKTGGWYDLKFIIGNGKTQVFANDTKVAESSIVPAWNPDQPVTINIGGFKGYMDELNIYTSR